MQTSRVGKYSSSWGFTLIELTVVIVILGIGLGLMAPLIQESFTGNDLKNSLRRMQGIVNELRYRAMIDKKTQILTIELNEQGKDSTYWVSSDGDKDKENNKRVLFQNDARLLAVKIMNNQPIRSGKAKIKFYPQGIAIPSALIVSTPDREYEIVIQSFSPNLLVHKALRNNKSLSRQHRGRDT